MLRFRQVTVLSFALFGLSAAAQTTAVTTNGGSTGTIPVYTSGSAVGNSVMTQSNGNIGIGTGSPTSGLTVVEGPANYDPLLTYNAPAAFSLQTAGGELAAGFATQNPWSLWLQARQETNVAWSMVLNPSGGNVGVGTLAPGAELEVNGNVKLTSGSGASLTFQDGSVQTVAWNGTLAGADYAESVDVTGDRSKYEPGDVLVADPGAERMFVKSATPYSTKVMGIYSTKPGVLGRPATASDAPLKAQVPMAMVGIVPTKVSAENGPIEPGDLLVTSSKMGYAMKGTDRSQMLGAVIGKALGHLNAGTGLIEVAVSLQ